MIGIGTLTPFATTVLWLFAVIYLLIVDRKTSAFRIVKVDNKSTGKVRFIIEGKSDFHSWKMYRDNQNFLSSDWQTIEEAQKALDFVRRDYGQIKDEMEYTVIEKDSSQYMSEEMEPDWVKLSKELDVPAKIRIDPEKGGLSNELNYMDSKKYMDLVHKECNDAFNLLVAMKGKSKAIKIIECSERIDKVQEILGIEFTAYFNSNVFRSMKFHSLAIINNIPGHSKKTSKTC